MSEPHEVSVVVPVFQGERTIELLLEEILPLTTATTTATGIRFVVVEVIFVHDDAIDESAEVMRALATRHAFVRTIWLSRNFGQHAATLAGMASSVGEWVVTLDEDGQHDPAAIPSFLDRAFAERRRLVYAKPTNEPPHGYFRNRASAIAKRTFALVTPDSIVFNSFRLVEGQVARGVAAQCGPNVYLDVALAWATGKPGYCPVALRSERGRPSSYTFVGLLRHFWQLVLVSGTLPLRSVAVVGLLSILFSLVYSAYQIWQNVHHAIPVRGWTSLIVAVCMFAGIMLVSLGIIAEYLAYSVSMAIGKPTYVIVSRPRREIGEER